MTEIAAVKVKEKMNLLGKNKIPFLFILNYDLSKGFIVENPLNQQNILFRTTIETNFSPNQNQPKPTSFFFKKNPLSFEEYKKRFDKIMENIKSGKTSLVNLTVKTAIETDLSFRDILFSSNSLYALYLPQKFVCFSPERFVKISNGIISTNPMKGTIDATIENAENIILSDKKESEEHATVVKLLKKDIGLVAKNVAVTKFRYLDKIQSTNGEILQVSSEIKGELPTEYFAHLGDIVFQLLPAGSIAGAPKPNAMEIIDQTEPEKRDYYSGIFGYFDGKEFDSGVLIRFIGQYEDGLYFHSGGGITIESNAKSEYKEMLKKIYLPF